MKSFVLFAAAAAALSAAPAAFADDPQAVITYQQSQLTSIQGVAALRAEIREAAEDVCVTSDFPSLSERRAQASCVQSAIEAGEAQLRQKLADAGLRHLAEAPAARAADAG